MYFQVVGAKLHQIRRQSQSERLGIVVLKIACIRHQTSIQTRRDVFANETLTKRLLNPQINQLTSTRCFVIPIGEFGKTIRF